MATREHAPPAQYMQQKLVYHGDHTQKPGNLRRNPRQPEDTPTASETPTGTQYKIARLQLKFIMGTTPKNHNKEVVYSIKGNPRQHEDMPTTSDTPPTGTQYIQQKIAGYGDHNQKPQQRGDLEHQK